MPSSGTVHGSVFNSSQLGKWWQDVQRGGFVFWQDEVGNGGVVGLAAGVGAHRWEEIVDILTAGAAVLQSETHYFESSEIPTRVAMGEDCETR
jgi:hypothetical protein